jgi:hypothetical protein
VVTYLIEPRENDGSCGFLFAYVKHFTCSSKNSVKSNLVYFQVKNFTNEGKSDVRSVPYGTVLRHFSSAYLR